MIPDPNRVLRWNERLDHLFGSLVRNTEENDPAGASVLCLTQDLLLYCNTTLFSERVVGGSSDL